MTADELYNRLLIFAQGCQRLVKKLPKTVYNIEYGAQLIRSSGSPGANYIEAIEGSSKKDFVHKLKICRKEAKESIYWLTLIHSSNEDLKGISVECDDLIVEGREFIKIFASSILTSERNLKINK